MRYDVHFYVDYDGKTKVARVPRKPRQGRQQQAAPKQQPQQAD